MVCWTSDKWRRKEGDFYAPATAARMARTLTRSSRVTRIDGGNGFTQIVAMQACAIEYFLYLYFNYMQALRRSLSHRYGSLPTLANTGPVT